MSSSTNRSSASEPRSSSTEQQPEERDTSSDGIGGAMASCLSVVGTNIPTSLRISGSRLLEIAPEQVPIRRRFTKLGWAVILLTFLSYLAAHLFLTAVDTRKHPEGQEAKGGFSASSFHFVLALAAPMFLVVMGIMIYGKEARPDETFGQRMVVGMVVVVLTICVPLCLMMPRGDIVLKTLAKSPPKPLPGTEKPTSRDQLRWYFTIAVVACIASKILKK